MKTLILIPSRLSATRLPGKPLLKIDGLSIISHVVRKAKEANIGEVIVAAEDKEIIDDVEINGGKAILTGNQHKTGTDRIYEALKKSKFQDIDFVMNLQGDEPLMNIEDIKSLNNHMIKNKSQLGTLASIISDKHFHSNTNIVKVKTKKKLFDTSFPEALDFMRKSNEKAINIYHHLGIYCYQTEILRKFVSFEQSYNEKQRSLEQIRALENGIDIIVGKVNEAPYSIDTSKDLKFFLEKEFIK